MSPVDLLEACIARIEEDDSRLRCFITLTLESARQEARAAQARAQSKGRLGPLDGIPLGVKDILASQGVRTTAGSKVLQHFVPDRDCNALSALKRAGAVIVGKTNLHEFAYGVTSANSYYGAVVNPLDSLRLVGGSSGGSAAAVASGMVLGAVGSDTGGSIRIPAAACGLFGLKPTFGLINCEGVIPQSWTLDHLGLLTRTAEDLGLMIQAWTGGPGTQTQPKSRMRIAIPENLLEAACSEVRAAFESSLGWFRRRGAKIETFRMPDLALARSAWLTILLAESAAYHRPTLEKTPEAIGDDIRPFLLAGLLIDASTYLGAQRFRREWANGMRAMMRDLDILAHPTFPMATPLRDQSEVETGAGPMSVRDAMVLYQWPANLLGWPALAIPCLEVIEGMPFSIMVTCKPNRDIELIETAKAYSST